MKSMVLQMPGTVRFLINLEKDLNIVVKVVKIGRIAVGDVLCWIQSLYVIEQKNRFIGDI